MIAAFMAYGFLIACILGLSALAIERGFSLLRWPCRFIWAVALLGSLCLPVAMIVVDRTPQTSARKIAIPDASHELRIADPKRAVGPEDFELIWVEGAQATAAVSASTKQAWGAFPDVDTALEVAWAGSSLAVLMLYSIGLVGLVRVSRRWEDHDLSGVAVSLSEGFGPAVFGFLRPKIVVPRWLVDVPSSTRNLAIEHEQSHVSARDPLLVLAGLLLVATAPWNLAMLWQLRRLRLAIEVDCDARVLRGNVLASDYGEMLLAMGQHQLRMPIGAVALTEPASQIERRIRAIMSGGSRHVRLHSTAGVMASLLLIVVAVDLAPPSLSRAPLYSGPQVRSADAALNLAGVPASAIAAGAHVLAALDRVMPPVPPSEAEPIHVRLPPINRADNSGTNLKSRIEGLITNRMPSSLGLTKKLLMASAAPIAVTIPLMVEPEDVGRGLSILGLCVTGCGTGTVGRKLEKLVGQDIHEAISQLGAPDDQPTLMDGEKNYLWTTNRNITAQVQSTHMSNAIADHRAVYETVTMIDTVRLDCAIHLATDQNDRIKSYRWSGDRYCSQYYVHLLKPPSQ